MHKFQDLIVYKKTLALTRTHLKKQCVIPE